MRPWIGIALAGTAVAALGTAVYLEKRAAAATSTPTTISFIGGDQTTITVALPGAINLASPPTIDSVTTSLQMNAASPSNYTVTSVTTSTTGVVLVVNAAASAVELSSTFATAVGAPATAAVTSVDNGPSNPAATSPAVSAASTTTPTVTPTPASTAGEAAVSASDAAGDSASANAGASNGSAGNTTGSSGSSGAALTPAQVAANAANTAAAAAAAAGIAAASSATPIPPLALTLADNDSTHDVAVGTLITVTLDEAPNAWTFSSAGAALEGQGVTTNERTQVATYKVVAAGTATISANDATTGPVLVPTYSVNIVATAATDSFI